MVFQTLVKRILPSLATSIVAFKYLKHVIIEVCLLSVFGLLCFSQWARDMQSHLRSVTPKFAVDLNPKHCIEDLHVALLLPSVWSGRAPKRGDLVYFSPTARTALSYVKDAYVVKRVTGVPKDTVLTSDRQVWINGQKVLQQRLNQAPNSNSNLSPIPYFDHIKGTKDLKVIQLTRDEVNSDDRLLKLSDTEYFVLGDELRSNDSRDWGPLREEEILGRAYRLF
jgi:signal peptidase I